MPQENSGFDHRWVGPSFFLIEYLSVHWRQIPLVKTQRAFEMRKYVAQEALERGEQVPKRGKAKGALARTKKVNCMQGCALD